MWQGSENLRATQKESRARNKQLTAVRYISNIEEIVNTSWLNIQHDGAAVSKLSESTPLPQAFSAKYIAGRQTQQFNGRPISIFDGHPAKSHQDSAPFSLWDCENWLDWNHDSDNPKQCKDDWEADNQSDIELDNGKEDLETPEQRDVNGAPNVPGFIQPIQRSKIMAAKVVVTDNAIETRRNMGNQKSRTECVNAFHQVV